MIALLVVARKWHRATYPPLITEYRVTAKQYAFLFHEVAYAARRVARCMQNSNATRCGNKFAALDGVIETSASKKRNGDIQRTEYTHVGERSTTAVIVRVIMVGYYLRATSSQYARSATGVIRMAVCH